MAHPRPGGCPDPWTQRSGLALQAAVLGATGMEEEDPSPAAAPSCLIALHHWLQRTEPCVSSSQSWWLFGDGDSYELSICPHLISSSPSSAKQAG